MLCVRFERNYWSMMQDDAHPGSGSLRMERNVFSHVYAFPFLSSSTFFIV